ncbi:DUF883 family protein [Microvirga pudoricolor]|uniref:DUF883 family protein n=1 Tax=Microvirga pudoricolor TaxID=2778729 RepID=UPI0019526B0F|nr:hypothetical protein [Microvirga pudoricolor]MBM6596259.1 hypothetical protein [Microvirga pudoricolor]
MADPKNNDTSKTTQSKTSDTTSKVSAGTSVGDIGSSPMPHAQGDHKSAQSSTLASHTSKPLGGSSGQHENKASAQGENLTDKAKDAFESASDTVRSKAGQAQKRAADLYDDASDWAQDTYDRASSWAEDRSGRAGERFGHARERSTRALGSAKGSLQHYVAENPMVVGIVGLATGLLIGALLPRTRKENETFGAWADEVREQGLRYAQDVTQRGRDYVEETFTGDDPRFSRHEADFRSDQNANRH